MRIFDAAFHVLQHLGGILTQASLDEVLAAIPRAAQADISGRDNLEIAEDLHSLEIDEKVGFPARDLTEGCVFVLSTSATQRTGSTIM